MNNSLNVKTINKLIEKDLRKIVLDTESKFRGQLFGIADRILHNKNIKIVLLSGPSCAGKTTCAKLLKEIFEKRGKNVVTISLDDFFKDRLQTPLLENGERDYDSPNALRLDFMKECFTRLFNGEEVEFPEFDFKNGKSVKGATLKMRYDTIIIFEGLHVLNPVIYNVLDLKQCYKIYVNALTTFSCNREKMKTSDIRLLRRIIRDVKKRGNTPEETLKSWGTVCSGEKKYITPYNKNADIMVDTTHAYELSVFKKEFDKLVKQKKITHDDVSFKIFLDHIGAIGKGILPDTSMLWEFMDKDVK